MPPALCGAGTGGCWGQGRGRRPILVSFQRGPAFPAALGKPHWGSRAARWVSPGLSTALLFSPHCGGSVSLQMHCPLPAQHSWPSPLAGQRSPVTGVTGRGAKSLFAEHSLSQVHFLLALPLRNRLRVHSQATCEVTEWFLVGEEEEGKQQARA